MVEPTFRLAVGRRTFTVATGATVGAIDESLTTITAVELLTPPIVATIRERPAATPFTIPV
jgi:hypothetical protein